MPSERGDNYGITMSHVSELIGKVKNRTTVHVLVLGILVKVARTSGLHDITNASGNKFMCKTKSVLLRKPFLG